MSENKRYQLRHDLIDTENNNKVICFFENTVGTSKIVDLLNEQEERIKELEKENEQLTKSRNKWKNLTKNFSAFYDCFENAIEDVCDDETQNKIYDAYAEYEIKLGIK